MMILSHQSQEHLSTLQSRYKLNPPSIGSPNNTLVRMLKKSSDPKTSQEMRIGLFWLTISFTMHFVMLLFLQEESQGLKYTRKTPFSNSHALFVSIKAIKCSLNPHMLA